MGRVVVWAAAALAAACAATLPNAGPAPVRAADGGGAIRVALAGGVPTARVSATGDWRLYDRGGRSVLVRAEAGDAWAVEQRAGRLRAVRADGTPSPFRDGPLIARPVGPAALVSLNGRRYRGELAVTATDSGLLVVNRLSVEDYLRGVVPLEIGDRVAEERAAVEAQAVAARSYAVVRLSGDERRAFDVVSTVADQVYGGADAEKPISDAAVASTAGLVLTFRGRVVNAPYHSTCGGSTAEAPEVWWHTPGEPYLRSVSDRIPGTDRFYCDPSPRFRWERNFDAPALAAAVQKYLAAYAALPTGGAGAVRALSVSEHTPSGRVAALTIETERGFYTLRGNDIRFVLRSRAGEILNSTYFSVDPTAGPDGRLARVTLRGNGYGHGIGMCQWGAIGRARAGQDYRAILNTYYPGTIVAPAS